MMFPIRDNIPSRTWPAVTWLLIAANCAAYALEIKWLVDLPPGGVDAMIVRYGLVPGTYFHPRLFHRLYGDLTPAAHARQLALPFFSYMFLHGGFFHLLLNMVCLFVFGDNVEDRLGHFRFLLFYLLGGVAAGLLHLLMGTTSPVPIVGASGAIAAVMGAYMLFFPRAQILTLVPLFCFVYFINIPAVLFLGFWFALQFFSGLGELGRVQAEGVAWWAHVGGFAFGMIFVLLLGGRSRTGPPRYETHRTGRRSIISMGR